jgi:hypothetical protein
MLVFPLVSLGLLLSGSVDGAALAAVRKIDAQTPPEVQMALALAAGPPVADKATVYVLGPKGYSRLKEGANGFSCIVQRQRLDEIAPQCFDAEGSATTLRVMLFVEEQRALGVKDSEIEKAVAAGYQAGRFKPPSKPGLVYMLSPYNYLWDPDGKKIVHFPGHLMFYAPYATSREVGSGPDAPYVVNPGKADALMIVIPRGSAHGESHAP